VEIERLIPEREGLALAQPGQTCDADRIAVRLDRLGREPLDLAPVEKAHLGPLATRRRDTSHLSFAIRRASVAIGTRASVSVSLA